MSIDSQARADYRRPTALLALSRTTAVPYRWPCLRDILVLSCQVHIAIRGLRIEDNEVENNGDSLDLTDLSVSLNLAEKTKKKTAWAALVSAHLVDFVVCP